MRALHARRGPDLAAALAPLRDRRSAQILVEPAPTDSELAEILQAACSAPDHGALRPYRFVVVRGDGRAALADALVSALAEAQPTASPEQRAKVRGKTTAAPLLVVVVAGPHAGHKVPEWEQGATAACAGFALVLATELAGYGAVWKSAGHMAGQALTGLFDLGPGEHLLGWVNIGTTGAAPAPRRPADLAEVVAVLDDARLRRWPGSTTG